MLEYVIVSSNTQQANQNNFWNLNVKQRSIQKIKNSEISGPWYFKNAWIMNMACLLFYFLNAV